MYKIGLSSNEVVYKTISDGNKGTMETLAEMEKLIKSGAKDPFVIEQTRNVIRNVPEKDYKGEVKKIFEFVQKNTRFTKDVVDVETLSAPQRMFRDISRYGKAYGDCDCKTIMLGSMLESVGHPVRLVVTSQMPSKEYQHVYLEVFLDGAWVPLDSSQQNVQMGWEQPSYTAKERFPLQGADEKSSLLWPIGILVGVLILLYIRKK